MGVGLVKLEGTFVRLVPMSLDHLDQLCEVGLDEGLWRFIPVRIKTREDMLQYIETALKWQAEGTALPFVTIEKTSNMLVGSTRYANIVPEHKRLEIGWTWVASHWQKTHVNTEAKYLMLKHAFETLGYNRVEFKTDSLNEKSRDALLGIGAKEEGIFRNHMVMPDGRLRHTVYFSIIRAEWNDVRKRLEQRMERCRDRQGEDPSPRPFVHG